MTIDDLEAELEVLSTFVTTHFQPDLVLWQTLTAPLVAGQLTFVIQTLQVLHNKNGERVSS